MKKDKSTWANIVFDSVNRISLFDLYKKILEDSSIIKHKNAVAQNFLHVIAMSIHDENDKNQKILIAECMNIVHQNINSTDLIDLIQQKDNYSQTPLEYAIEYDNLYLFKHFVNKTYIDPWDYLQKDQPPQNIQAFLLKSAFNLKLNDLNHDQNKLILINKMNEKQVPFVLNVLNNSNFDCLNVENYFSQKIISYNNPYLIAMMLDYDIGEYYVAESTNNLINIINLCVQEERNTDRCIKSLLSYTNRFSLTEYNKLIKTAINICLYSDTYSYNIFHKLATISKLNREDNFDELMFDTLSIVVTYLNNQNTTNARSIIESNDLFNRSALSSAITLNQVSFVNALVKLQVFDYEDLIDFDIFKMSEPMMQVMKSVVLSKAGICSDDLSMKLSAKEVVARAASILIETSDKNSIYVVIDIFIDNGISLDFQSFSHKTNRQTSGANNTLLHKACAFGNEDAVNKLIANKANINLQNKEGFTPIAIAASLNEPVIIRILFKANADLNTCSADGNSLLHYATIHENNYLIKKLLYFNLDCAQKNTNGNSSIDFLWMFDYENKQIKSTGQIDSKNCYETFYHVDLTANEFHNNEDI